MSDFPPGSLQLKSKYATKDILIECLLDKSLQDAGSLKTQKQLAGRIVSLLLPERRMTPGHVVSVGDSQTHTELPSCPTARPFQ